SSSWRPGCATRSRSSSGSSAEWTRPAWSERRGRRNRLGALRGGPGVSEPEGVGYRRPRDKTSYKGLHGVDFETNSCHRSVSTDRPVRRPVRSAVTRGERAVTICGTPAHHGAEPPGLAPLRGPGATRSGRGRMSGYVARVRRGDLPGGGTEFERLMESAARRWASIDPLLPAPPRPRRSGDTLLTVSDEAGRPVAAGTMRYSWYQPGEVGRTWGMPDQHWLTPLVGGPEPGRALDSLLTSWREQLEALPTGTGSESSALLTWPARDVCGVVPLQRHGLQPFSVLAVRRRGRGVPPVLPPRDVVIRLADSGDLTEAVALLMEQHRFEEDFGGVFVQAETAEQTRGVLARALSRRPSWIWVAERRGRLVGLVWVSPPQRARWAAPLVSGA